MKTTLALLIAAGAIAVSGARAADTSDPVPGRSSAKATADKLADARNHIQAKRWAAAIEALKAVNDTGSADWNNLMGYSLRKAKTPDLDAAQTYYDAALRIDPKHRNALEYSGELFLMKGDLAGAEGRLATLASVCGSCEQHTDLKTAIDKYKASGNKYVATW